jgi:hypothetical protein
MITDPQCDNSSFYVEQVIYREIEVSQRPSIVGR